MLRADRARLLAAVIGVMFSCVLMFMQFGFRDALFRSAMALVTPMRADAFLIHRMTVASFKPEAFPRIRASQAMALPEVASVVPVYLAQTSWRNPHDGTRHTVQLVGFEPGANVVQMPGLAPLSPALRRQDTVAFDRLSRPEFGDVAALLRRGGEFTGQLGTRAVTVVGLVEVGSSFAAGGHVVLSESNFLRVVSGRSPNTVDLVAVRFTPSADHKATVERLRRVLPSDVQVLTRHGLAAHERSYWDKATPIGFVFGFGSLMALVIGLVVVYQVLFSHIASHLREYATLKAMGYSNSYLYRAVCGSALILAVLGFLPGLGLSIALYDLARLETLLPIRMEAERVAAVFTVVFAMCSAAGLLAVRKLREAVPAEMF
jgi:putative ABC transport system permease protein